MHVHSPRQKVQLELVPVRQDRQGRRVEAVEQVLWSTSRTCSSRDSSETMNVTHTTCTLWDYTVSVCLWDSTV